LVFFSNRLGDKLRTQFHEKPSPKPLPGIKKANENLWKVDNLMFDIGKMLLWDVI